LDVGKPFLTQVKLGGGKGSTFRWTRNGADLPTDDPRFTGVTSPKLLIKKLTPGDAGVYACRVTYKGHSITVDTDFLEVPGAAPEKMEGLDDIHFGLGSPIEAPGWSPDHFFASEPAEGAPCSSPTSYRYDGLPRGLRYDKTTGLISGIPQVAGIFPVNVIFTNSFGSSAPSPFRIIVDQIPPTAQGSYFALVGRSLEINRSLGGYLKFNLAATGAYTASLRSGAFTWTTKGRTWFDDAETPVGLELEFPRRGQPSLSVLVELDPGSGTLTGTVFEPELGVEVSLSGWRNAWTNGQTPGGVAAGTHRFKLVTTGLSNAPETLGTLTVSRTGTTTTVGKTADGAAFSSTGLIGPAGFMSIYGPTLSHRASLLGSFSLQSANPTPIFSGNLDWQKVRVLSPRETPIFGPFGVSIVNR